MAEVSYAPAPEPRGPVTVDRQDLAAVERGLVAATDHCAGACAYGSPEDACLCTTVLFPAIEQIRTLLGTQ